MKLSNLLQLGGTFTRAGIPRDIMPRPSHTEHSCGGEISPVLGITNLANHSSTHHLITQNRTRYHTVRLNHIAHHDSSTTLI